MKQHTVNKYFEILKDFYYLDSEENLRYKKEGYLNRYKKDDIVKSHKESSGYLVVIVPTIRNKSNGATQVKLAHVIWRLAGNKLPDELELDHIDGNRLNNKTNNLRVVDRRINSRNRKKRSDNTSGYTGISWNKGHKAYAIRKTIGTRRIATYRKTLEEAVEVLKYFESLDSSYTDRHGK